MQIIKLNELDRWLVLGPKQGISFDAAAARKVRLQLNSQAYSSLYILSGKKEKQQERFLCAIPAGLSVVEWYTGTDAFQVVSDTETEIFYQSSDLESSAVENLDPEIFTKIAARRARNPELEAIQWAMQQNMERRFAQLQDGHKADLAALAGRIRDETEQVDDVEADDDVGAASKRKKVARKDNAKAAPSPDDEDGRQDGRGVESATGSKGAGDGDNGADGGDGA